MSDFSWLKLINDSSLEIQKKISLIIKSLYNQPILGYEIDSVARYIKSINYHLQKNYPVKNIVLCTDFTSEPFANVIRLAMLKLGFNANVFELQPGTYSQVLMDKKKTIFKKNPDLFLIIPSVESIVNLKNEPLQNDDINKIINLECNKFKNVWNTILKNSNAKILQQFFEIPEEDYLGLSEDRSNWTNKSIIKKLNNLIVDESKDEIYFYDINNLIYKIGQINWFDNRMRDYGNYSFSNQYLSDYLIFLESYLRNIFALSYKALIVDLDNTLWGGILGDDGIENIEIGPDTPNGRSYLKFAYYLKALSIRGVILGICSKNDLSNVVKVFDKHPHLPLILNDFSVIRCNWIDKASNLISIANELNIDRKSIVFIDDNQAECELVRTTVPDITTIFMGDEPSEFIRKLELGKYFNSQILTNEDLTRTNSYRARKQFLENQNNSLDLNDFLKSLEMKGSIWEAKENNIQRLEQMEQKTNQFNLTTQRLSIDQIKSFVHDTNYGVYCFNLNDKFADHGLVGSMIVKFSNIGIEIISWLLSCRVFSRGCEEYMFNFLNDVALKRKLKKISGRYVQTKKNSYIENLLPNLGFEKVNKNNDYVISVDKKNKKKTHIK